MITVLQPGDPRRQGLDVVQARIAELVTARKAIATAAVPPDELRQRCARAVGNLVADDRAAAPVRYLAQPGALPNLVERDDTARDLTALLVHLIGEQIIVDRLVERASAHGYAPGLPAAERARRLAELDRALHELCIAEEIEARKLEAAGGVFVMRRPIAQLDLDAILTAWDQAA